MWRACVGAVRVFGGFWVNQRDSSITAAPVVPAGEARFPARVLAKMFTLSSRLVRHTTSATGITFSAPRPFPQLFLLDVRADG
ncbi:hypothetical protein B7486_13775 [cyanobacterium TDX16]|nr:hypothetical protein B7486_13775 [cyanobacterium TDX16]